MARKRLLAPSSILRTTPKQVGGGHEREELVEHARESIRRGSKSFAFASRLFDRQTRERAWLLYAWCRRCDDIADGQDHGGTLKLDSSTAQHRIDAIRVLTDRALEGQPTAEIAFDAFGQVAQECGLTEEMANDVIDGFALDARDWRPRTEGEMMRYCFHVAGAVGVMMARVMGVPKDATQTLDRACDLGLAFQLNNIARDVWEDDAAGRCYLPMEWLSEADIPPGQHMKPQFRPQLVKMVRRIVEMAEDHDKAARWGAAALPFRQRWAILSAANIYGAIGQKVRELGPAAWDHRVHISAAEKARLVARAFWDAFETPSEPEELPRWTRGDLMVMARMDGPPAPMPMTPLREEDE